MSTLVFLLEEPSAQDALEGILPRILPDDIDVQYLVFEGKQDLERRMGRRMRAWLHPDTRFIVLRDQDSGDCRTIKSNLARLCREAGKPDTLVRIACRELESWFVGDLAAILLDLDRPHVGVFPASVIGRPASDHGYRLWL